MSAQAMSPSELLDATAGWAAAATGAAPGPTRAFLESSPTASMFLPAIDRCRATLAQEPADGSELARLTKQLGDLDTDHDDLGRFMVGTFTTYEHHSDAALATLAKQLLLQFFPSGLAFIRASYGDEAGMAASRATLLTPDRRAQLARFPIASSGAPQTLADCMDQLQSIAASIGETQTRRATLASDGSLPTAQAILDAKRELIQLVQQIFSTWTALKGSGLLDGTSQTYAKSFEDEWKQRVTTATANAAARRAAAATGTTTSTTPAAPATGTTPPARPAGSGSGSGTPAA